MVGSDWVGLDLVGVGLSKGWVGLKRDTCYDRGSTFRVKWFLHDGAPYPKIFGEYAPLMFAWFSLCTLAVRFFSSAIKQLSFSSKNQSSG